MREGPLAERSIRGAGGKMAKPAPRTKTRALVSAVTAMALWALAVAAAQGSGVTPTNAWVDIYSSHSSFAGVPIPVGSYVAAFDPQGTQCGERTVTMSGYIAPLMACYGDDSNTSGDEGAVEGDILSFSVNGTWAAVRPRALNFESVPPETPVAWHDKDVWEVDLVVPPQPYVSIAHMPGQTRLWWQPAEAEVSVYEVWRSAELYFIPGEGQAELLGTVAAGAVPLEWYDGAGVANPDLNYAYRVVSRDATSRMVGVSQAVAEFDFALAR